MSDEHFFNFSASAQLVIDPLDNRLVSANQEACRLLGLDRVQLRTTRATELFRDSIPELLSFTQELMAKGRGWSDQLLVSNGEDSLPVEAQGRYSTAGDETLLHLTLNKSEELEQLRERSDVNRYYRSGIGHWNRVSRVFQEFERENQLLLDAAGEGIYGVDTNGITTFVNPAAQRILGYSAGELAWRNMHTMVHHSHSDGSHFSARECPIFKAFTVGKVQTVEDDVFWSKSGDPIDVEYTSTPIRDNGEIVGAVVVFRDISQKKADKRKLLEALEEVEELKNRLEMENAYLQEEINSEFNHRNIIGKSAAVQALIQKIEMVAPTDSTVLIQGESGTGKELVARAIHELSSRSERSLIRVNCAAIPKDLFESEFFGHIKGAFTGATSDRPGRFELADGGTLFLDEVGEIPLELQGKLLRVLQEQQFERLGDTHTRKVDVRIITATNRDLEALMREGRFREDLYFRLHVFPIQSVPLRQRKDDIPLLTQHFLDKACKRANKPGLRIPISEIERLQAYDWPGNIRELENVVERQVILARGDTLRFPELSVTGPGSNQQPTDSADRERILTASELKERERRNLIRALERCGGKIFGPDGAADLLAMKPTTLASQIKKFRIDTRLFKSSPFDGDSAVA